MVKRKLELAAVGGMAAVAPALASVKARFANERISDVDGVRVDFADGWVHLRASNTEPIVRIIAEAATAARANELCDECAKSVPG
jgi:phosphomannomutase